MLKGRKIRETYNWKFDNPATARSSPATDPTCSTYPSPARQSEKKDCQPTRKVVEHLPRPPPAGPANLAYTSQAASHPGDTAGLARKEYRYSSQSRLLLDG